MNFNQTLELMDENGVTAYKLIEDSKRPAVIGGPSLCNSSLCAELREHLFSCVSSVAVQLPLPCADTRSPAETVRLQ